MIESLYNNSIKHACALKQKKYRDQQGEFIAEGIRLVLDIAQLSCDSIVRVFATESAKNAIVKLMPNYSFQVVLVSDLVIKKLSDTQNSQGVVAVVKKKQQSKELCNTSYLFLDRIRDPGNLGTIIRTAAAAGYSLILNSCVDVYSPKVIRSCMGGIMSAEFVESDIDALIRLKNNGYTVVSADLNGENLFQSTKHKKVCIVVGNEAEGVSLQAKSVCDKSITIPMQATESLNAAVSAGIIMYYYKY